MAEKEEKPIGEITHYFSNLEVGIIKLKSPLVVGDKIKIKGATTDFEQTVDSIQIEHEQVEKAKKGDLIGIKVGDKVREGDLVYKAE
jgi:putative protease